MTPAHHPCCAAPPETEALVVFIRPDSMAQGTLVTLMDEHLAFLGELGPQSCFATTVAAGPNLFVGWSENTSVLDADLLAGHTYFVEVTAGLGAISARAQLFSVREGRRLDAKVLGWLSDCTFLEADVERGQAWIDAHHDEARRRLRDAREALSRYRGQDLDVRTLRPSDGRLELRTRPSSR